jgi:putative proteasome-type protease
MRLNKGLVFMSDTRTNAGVDDISQVRRCGSGMYRASVITLMSAGNLATTQAVVSRSTSAPRRPRNAIPPSSRRLDVRGGDDHRETLRRS